MTPLLQANSKHTLSITKYKTWFSSRPSRANVLSNPPYFHNKKYNAFQHCVCNCKTVFCLVFKLGVQLMNIARLMEGMKSYSMLC